MFPWVSHWSLGLVVLALAAIWALSRDRRALSGSGAWGGDILAMTEAAPTGGPETGSSPPMTEQKYCFGCGVLIHKTAIQCPRCGAPQTAPLPVGQKSRIAAVIFALLLGGIGVHKFYLGRVGQGIVYILFCWTCIPSLVGLVEGIIYLTMTDQAFAAKYG
jgi:TM2 domain-containing membrane protein YozV